MGSSFCGELWPGRFQDSFQMHHPRSVRINVGADLHRQFPIWRDELAATGSQFPGRRRRCRFETTGNRNLRFDPPAQTVAVAACGSCPDPREELRTSEPEDRATGRSAGIATLFIHARHHFLTLEFTRNGAKQAAVFEIGKAMPLTLLPVLEAKTGKKVEYQSKKK